MKVKLPNKIVLIVIDALRHDASRLFWPHFNVIFTQHYTSHNWTLPAMTRLLTGKYDNGHEYLKKMDIDTIYKDLTGKLKVPTIGKYFKDQGWRTYGKGEGLYVSRHFGFGKDGEWDVWHDEGRADASKVLQPVFIDDKKEFRLYHEYYLHDYFKDTRSNESADKLHEGVPGVNIAKYYWKNFDELQKWEQSYWYRAYVLTDLMKWVPDSDALVILTSDHGEAFAEFYGDTGHTEQHMVEEVAHIPLMMHWPGMRKKRISQFTRDIDVLPTLLELIGHKAKLDGNSLLPIMLDPKKQYNPTYKGKYVHRSNQLWKYYFSSTEKRIEFIKALGKPPKSEILEEDFIEKEKAKRK